MSNEITWTIIDDLAGQLGAREAARMKWRQRGVPAEWQIRLVRMAEARAIPALTFDAMDDLPRSRPRESA